MVVHCILFKVELALSVWTPDVASFDRFCLTCHYSLHNVATCKKVCVPLSVNKIIRVVRKSEMFLLVTSLLFFLKGVWLFLFDVFEYVRLIFSFPCRKWQGTIRTVSWTLIGLILQERGSRRIIRKHKMVNCWVCTSSCIMTDNMMINNQICRTVLVILLTVALALIVSSEMTSIQSEIKCKRGSFRLKTQIG